MIDKFSCNKLQTRLRQYNYNYFVTKRWIQSRILPINVGFKLGSFVDPDVVNQLSMESNLKTKISQINDVIARIEKMKLSSMHKDLIAEFWKFNKRIKKKKYQCNTKFD